MRAILVSTILTILAQRSYQEIRILGGGGHGVALTNYNCTSNCLQCEVKAPHKCHKCLFQFFVNEGTSLCQQCKVDRCNLCSEAKKCKTCRVGHTPDGEKCVPSTWFVIFAYSLFLLSFGMGILFFFISIYFCFTGNGGDNHGHAHGGHAHGKKGLQEDLNRSPLTH